VAVEVLVAADRKPPPPAALPASRYTFATIGAHAPSCTSLSVPSKSSFSASW